jgi:anti-anti-sigma factor
MRVEQHDLTIAVATRGELLIVFLDGTFDATSAAVLTKTLEGLARQRFEQLWISLAGVTHIDAEAIDALLAARTRTRQQHRQFLIRSPSSAVTHYLEAHAACAVLIS